MSIILLSKSVYIYNLSYVACVWISLLLLSFFYLFIFFTKCVWISYACNVRNNPLLFLCQCYPILAPLPIDLRNWKSIIGFSIEKGKGVFFNHYIYTCCIKYFIVFYIRFGFKKCCTCARVLDLWIGGLLFRGRYLTSYAQLELYVSFLWYSKRLHRFTYVDATTHTYIMCIVHVQISTFAHELGLI